MIRLDKLLTVSHLIIFASSYIFASQILVENCISISTTALHDAVAANDLTKVQCLIQSDSKLLEMVNEAGATPLHIAAETGSVECLIRLINAQAHLEARDSNGSTPLQKAACSNMHACLSVLLEFGAEKDVVDNLGYSALNWAVAKGSLACVKLLLEAGAPNADSAFLSAAQNGNREGMLALLDWGVAVNVRGPNSETALHRAINRGHIECVQELLSKDGILVDAEDISGYTPLHVAAINGLDEGVILLLEAGADINAKDKGHKTPLHHAALRGHSKCVRHLIRKMIDLRSQQAPIAEPWNYRFIYAHDTELHDAIATDNIEKVIALLQDAPLLVKCTTAEGRLTPLHIAAEKGNIECLIRLINAQANLEARDNKGNTPLHCAAGANMHACLSVLLEFGAEKDVVDNLGFSVLDWAAARGSLDCVRLLLEAGAHNDFSALLFSADAGTVECMLELLNWGVEVNSRGSSNETALHRAANNGRFECVTALLQRENLLVDAQDSAGHTPLHLAIQKGNRFNCFVILLEAGASVTIPDNRGNTALHLAAANLGKEYLHEILKRHMALELTNNFFQTPLHIAAGNGNPEFVVSALAAGANIHARSNRGSSPLHIASHYGHKECVKELLQAGAEVLSRDDYGWSPLFYAANQGHTECVALLSTSSALINARSLQGKSALYVSILNSQINSARYLIAKQFMALLPSKSVVSECKKRVKEFLLCCNRVKIAKYVALEILFLDKELQMLVATIFLDELCCGTSLKSLLLQNAHDITFDYLCTELGRILEAVKIPYPPENSGIAAIIRSECTAMISTLFSVRVTPLSLDRTEALQLFERHLRNGRKARLDPNRAPSQIDPECLFYSPQVKNQYGHLIEIMLQEKINKLKNYQNETQAAQHAAMTQENNLPLRGTRITQL